MAQRRFVVGILDDSGDDYFNRRAPKMVMRSGTLFFTAPFGAVETDSDDHGINWQETSRPGDKPDLQFSSKKRHKYSMTLFLGSSDRQKDVEAELRTLRYIAGSRDPVQVAYGPHESGIWRITNFSYAVKARTLTNAISRCEVDIEFTNVSDLVTNALPPLDPQPIPQVAQVKPPAAPPAVNATSRPRTYVVVRGDTLWGIAVRFYGSGPRWTGIADANGVSDPKRLPIGKTLTIP